jgi:hypothetical protein
MTTAMMQTSEFVPQSDYPARLRSPHAQVKMSILHAMHKIFAEGIPLHENPGE